jgi:hypothetical protein
LLDALTASLQMEPHATMTTEWPITTTIPLHGKLELEPLKMTSTSNLIRNGPQSLDAQTESALTEPLVITTIEWLTTMIALPHGKLEPELLKTISTSS